MVMKQIARIEYDSDETLKGVEWENSTVED